MIGSPEYGDAVARPLQQYLNELLEQLRALPITSAARGALIRRIRDVEDRIAWSEGL
jgi:hypothetical protein